MEQKHTSSRRLDYFDLPTGPRIEIEEDMKAVDFFQLYFTDTVWNHNYRGLEGPWKKDQSSMP